MFHRTVLSIFLACCSSSFASLITVSGTVAANTAWNADTVVLTGDVTVNNGVVLTVAAGTRVEAAGQYQIQINGRIAASGLASDSIVFTAQDTAAGWRGFALSSPSTNDTTIFSSCVIEHAKKTGNGGAISAVSGKMRVSRSLLQYNSGTNGGAFSCEGAVCIIDNCLFSRNTASGKGGAYYKYHVNIPTVTNSTFSDNAAYDGGAVYLDGWFGNFDRCTFIRNRASNCGGGIYIYEGPANLYNCRFSQDSAGLRGGGIYDCDEHSYTRNYTGCLLDGNMAGGSGGGAYVYDFGLGMTSYMINCTFANNRAPEGGGILSYAVNVYLINTVLWGNTSTLRGPQFCTGGTLNYDDTYLYIKYSTIQGGTGPFGGSAYKVINDTALSTGNPLFSDTASGNYRLTVGSPCIDSGRADTAGLGLLPTDLDGLPRCVNGRIDQGVYEYQTTTSVVPKIYRHDLAPASNPRWYFDILGRRADGYSSRILVAPSRGTIVTMSKHHTHTALYGTGIEK
jgi:hypothetical protein